MCSSYIRGHGLFSQHPDPLFQRRDNVLVVRIVNGRNDERVQVLLFEHLRKVGRVILGHLFPTRVGDDVLVDGAAAGVGIA